MKNPRSKRILRVVKPHAVKLMAENKKSGVANSATLTYYAELTSMHRGFNPPAWIADLEEDYLYPQEG